MAEKEVECWGVFQFASGKSKDICCVKFCRCSRIPARLICYRHKQRLWRMRNPTRAAWHTLKDHAKSRKLPFKITFEEFVELCLQTGYIESKGNHAEDLHIDRINPNKGYVLSNIQVLTCSENSAKGSYERWITLRSGKRVRLYEIGIGLPAPKPDPEKEWEAPAWLTNKQSDDEPF